MKTVDPQTIDLGTINTHKKATSIAFYNPANQAPYVNIVEATVDDNGVEVPHSEHVNYLVTYGEVAEIPVINPLTGEPTGDMVAIDNLMALMYSVYIYARSRPVVDDTLPPTV